MLLGSLLAVAAAAAVVGGAKRLALEDTGRAALVLGRVSVCAVPAMLILWVAARSLIPAAASTWLVAAIAAECLGFDPEDRDARNGVRAARVSLSLVGVAIAVLGTLYLLVSSSNGEFSIVG